jgi:hypothetical protein
MRKLDFSITMIDWLILFKEIIALCSENCTETLNTKCGITDCQSMWYMYLPLRFTWLVFKDSARSCFLSLEFNGKNFLAPGKKKFEPPMLNCPCSGGSQRFSIANTMCGPWDRWGRKVVTKENVQNSTTEHETSRLNSENPNEDQDAECIFCKVTCILMWTYMMICLHEPFYTNSSVGIGTN